MRRPDPPATLDALRERLAEIAGTLTPRLCDAARHALEHPNDPADPASLDHLSDDAHRLPLGKAIGALARARLVYVVGLRRSYAVASYLAYALNRVGRPSVQILGPVAQGADIVLQVHDAELLGWRSLTAAMALAQTLAMGLAFRERGRRGAEFVLNCAC